MVTGITYILTSLTLAILMPVLLVGSGHAEVGSVSTYRYPRRVCWFFLGALPIYGAMSVFIFSTMSPQERASIAGMAVFATVWSCILGLFVCAYFYFDRYRVQIDDHLLTIKSPIGRKVIELARVAQIVVLRGRATDLMLFDADNHILAKIGGSLQDFDSFLSELKLHTRSHRVTLYEWGQSGKWREAVNSGAEHWVDSEGPKRFRDMNRHVKYILVIGILLIAVAALAAWLNGRE